jgi:hypothetical protein
MTRSDLLLAQHDDSSLQVSKRARPAELQARRIGGMHAKRPCGISGLTAAAYGAVVRDALYF